MSGPAGTNVSLHHAEILMADGSGMIYTANLRSALVFFSPSYMAP